MPSPSAAAERPRDGRTRVRATARRTARCLVVVACLGGCATKPPLLPKTAEMSEGIPADAHMKVLTKRRLPTAPKARPKAPPLPTIPGRRIALVIGNGAYERRPLGNSVRDAKRLAQALRAPSLGFAVIERKNLDREGMRDALREFRRQLAGAQVALFYYAGHGVQAAGRNYMLPIGSLDEMATQEDYSIHGVDVDEVQQLLARSQTAARLTILDACRDNPLPTRTGAGPKGWADVAAGTSSLIAYATAPGKVAQDGAAGGNGPYVEHLLRHISDSTLSLNDLFSRVAREVGTATRGAQQPMNQSSGLPVKQTLARR